METLNNYITERIRVDNIKHREFPIDGTQEDMIQFLENQGYFGFSWLSETPSGWSKVFNYYKQKSFFSKPEDRWGYAYLKFADTTNNNIGKENPIYEIRFEGNNKIFNNIMYGNRSIPVSKEEFLERLNKQFNW
jgi:hypothetical protein